MSRLGKKGLHLDNVATPPLSAENGWYIWGSDSGLYTTSPSGSVINLSQNTSAMTTNIINALSKFPVDIDIGTYFNNTTGLSTGSFCQISGANDDVYSAFGTSSGIICRISIDSLGITAVGSTIDGTNGIRRLYPGTQSRYFLYAVSSGNKLLKVIPSTMATSGTLLSGVDYQAVYLTDDRRYFYYKDSATIQNFKKYDLETETAIATRATTLTNGIYGIVDGGNGYMYVYGQTGASGMRMCKVPYDMSSSTEVGGALSINVAETTIYSSDRLIRIGSRIYGFSNAGTPGEFCFNIDTETYEWVASQANPFPLSSIAVTKYNNNILYLNSGGSFWVRLLDAGYPKGKLGNRLALDGSQAASNRMCQSGISFGYQYAWIVASSNDKRVIRFPTL